MSANITSMKFSVFGRGYDDTRVSSGEGVEEEIDRYAMNISDACFDSTGQYLWLACHGSGHTAGLLKYDIETWTEETHTIPTAQNGLRLFKATNVDNNLGFAVQNGDWWVFDLTDDTIVASGTSADLNTWIVGGGFVDVVLDGTTYIMTLTRTTNGTIARLTFDYTDSSFNQINIAGNQCGGYFISKSLIYYLYPPAWFYQNKSIYACDTSGNVQWTDTAAQSGASGYPNISMWGFGMNGKLYLPTLFYSSWRIGEYNGSHTPNVVTPKPVRVFGKMTGTFDIKRYARSNDEKRFAITTGLGVFVSDLEDVILIHESQFNVLAVNDNYVICDESNNHLSVIKYR